jgi:hypothetical protein
MILQTRNVYERESKNLNEKGYLGELSMEGRLTLILLTWRIW